MASGSHGYSRSCTGLARLSGMAVIRLSMHAYYRPAGDCACTAKTLDEAVQDLGAGENIVRDFGDAHPTMLPWRSLAGVIAHLAADPVRRRTLIGEQIRVAQLFEVPIAFGVARRRRALTETGEQALGTLREAITVLASTEASLELARAHASLGRGLRHADQRVEARAQLGIAVDLADRCGATGAEADIREELAGDHSIGAHRRGVPDAHRAQGRPTRTQGISNSGIAEQTFASRKTRGMAHAQYLPQARNRVPRPAADTHQRLNPPRLRRRRPLKPFTPGANPLRRGWRCRPRGFLGSRS